MYTVVQCTVYSVQYTQYVVVNSTGATSWSWANCG